MVETENRDGSFPKEVADIIATLRDEPKDSPETFIGRSNELRLIMANVHASINTKRKENLEVRETGYQPGVLQIITGGPGAGKTSLLEAIEDKCRFHQCRVIRLIDDDLRDPTTLSHAIRESCHWRGRDTLTALGKELTKTTAASADAAAGSWLRHLLRALLVETDQPGADLDARSIRPARAVLECWERDEPAEPADVLKLLSRVGPTIITIDEAHLLDRYLDTNRSETTRTVIRTLATPAARKKENVNNCMMLVAGLNDLHPTITNLGTFRQTPIQLGGFIPEDVTKVLEHWIDRATTPIKSETDVTDEARAQAKAEWVPTLAREFCHWPHHTIGAGMGARAMLELAPENAPQQPWSLPAIREIGENYREWLYGYIADMAQKQNTPLEAVLAIAHVIGEGSGTISQLQAELVAGRTLAAVRDLKTEADPKAEEPPELPTAKIAVQMMLRAGILEYADLSGKHRQPSQLRIAVPSLGAYLRSIPLEPNGPATRAIAATEAARVQQEDQEDPKS